MSIVYLNGDFLPVEQAKVSVLDRGFLFADGVYEVVTAYNGQLFSFDAHLQRLQHSLRSCRIPLDWSLAHWQDALYGLLEKNGLKNASLYLEVTRGVASSREHVFDEQLQPTVFAMATPLPEQLRPDLVGVSALTVQDIRWRRCDIKSVSLLANVLMRQQAADAGCDEAILINEGFAIEGATSNLFIVNQGQLVTRPCDERILSGITRFLILELARQHGVPWREDNISLQQLYDADEVWLSSSTKGIRAVTKIDERVIGTGKPGALYGRMHAYYVQKKKELEGAI